MRNYYKYKIDSAIDTFSQFEAGINFKFETTTFPSLINFEKGDLIIGVKQPNSYYLLLVNDFNSNELSLQKQIEICSSYSVYFENEESIIKIEFSEYDEILKNILNEYNSIPTKSHSLSNISDFSNLKERFADWLINLDGVRHNYYRNSFNSNREKLLEQLTKYEDIYREQFQSPIFEISDVNLDVFVQELEVNLYLTSGTFFSFSEKISYHLPRAILGKKNYIKFLKELLSKSKISSAQSKKVDPVNKIYFGAPGTGKSYKITQDLKDVDLIFQKRVTFHPEYDHASFIGGYKPITNENGDIKYEFVPQIFTDIYIDACNDPIHQYYLIIEEINRGNCAEIFGELFQLLDRNIDYKITPSNELIHYLNNNITNSEYYKDNKMLMPSNLSILSTMNTSDQSLFPMDSAFKRRWQWEYVPIDYEKDPNKNKSANFLIQIDSKTTINWIDFIERINTKIQNNSNLGMDKCIGNYFVVPNAKNIIDLENFIHKVIFYLWNDVFKDEPRDSIFQSSVSYQSFFPINPHGVKEVKKILEVLNLISSNENTTEIRTENDTID